MGPQHSFDLRNHKTPPKIEVACSILHEYAKDWDSFYSGPPLLTTDQCSCGGNHFTISLLRDASKQEQISTSDRWCFADLFALFREECMTKNKQVKEVYNDQPLGMTALVK